MKIGLSQAQFNRLRIVYAVLLACYYGLTPEILFKDGVNPRWIRGFDVLGKDVKDFNKRLPTTAEEMKNRNMGFLKFRKTKKGAIIYVNLVRVKEIKKEKKK